MGRPAKGPIVHDAPTSPIPQPSGSGRISNRARVVLGWIALVFGCLVLVTGLFQPGRLSSALLGAAFLAVGALLIWRVGTWKTVTPAALALLVFSGITTPEPSSDASTTEAAATSSAAPTTTTTAATTTTRATTTVPVTSEPVVASTTVEPVDLPTIPVTTVAQPSTIDPALIITEPVETPVYTPAPVVTEAPVYTQTVETYVPAPLVDVPNTSVSYENCAAVRAAGADPILRGQPGYDSISTVTGTESAANSHLLRNSELRGIVAPTSHIGCCGYLNSGALLIVD